MNSHWEALVSFEPLLCALVLQRIGQLNKWNHGFEISNADGEKHSVLYELDIQKGLLGKEYQA